MIKLAARLHFLPLIFVPFVALALFGLMAGVSTIGCGPPPQARWTDDDTARELAQKNASMQLENICSRDGGPCPAGPVRSIEKSMCLNAAAALYDHGQGPADGGCP